MAVCRQLMCPQSTKDMLERVVHMVHSYDFNGLCLSSTPKTTPVGLEVSSITEPSLAGCSRQQPPSPFPSPCPPFSRSSKKDSLHTINPAFRLASPSPSLSHTTLILGDGPDVSFIPLP
ncbi:hypothetical protein LDENG_00288440 [Lucifuga dentata]|nr:hypothetical protein LDENG_00288440 [Lucifuga dentata]